MLERTAALEKQLAQHMLDPQIYQGQDNLLEAAKKLHSKGKQFVPMERSVLLDVTSCGNFFGCGM